MTLKHLTGRWSLFLLAAVISGVQLQTNNSSVTAASDADVQIYRPVLQPSESIPPTGTYVLRTPEGKPCIRADMGAEFIIDDKKTWYFNLDPSRVRTTGYCEKEISVLSLTLPDNSASLQLFFKKDKKVFYLSKLTAHLTPLPVCRRCSNATYSGLMDRERLFVTTNGQSFNCKSENVMRMSSQMRIKLVPLQMQAFTLSNGNYGKDMECWADFNKRVIPIVVGAIVVGLLLIAGLTYLFIKDRRSQGYERL